METSSISTNDLPTSVEAEQAVLGSVLIDSDVLKDVRTILQPEDFFTAHNADLFRAICRMADDGKAVDGITLAGEINADDVMRRYIADILNVTPTSANAMEYAQIVLIASKRRALLLSLRDAQDKLMAGEELTDVLAFASGRMEAIQSRETARLASPAQQLSAFWDRRQRMEDGKQPCIPSGFKPLDKILSGGFQRTGFYVLAARPGMGKTTLALNIAENVAKARGPVLYASLEMGREEIICKRLAMNTYTPYQSLLNGAVLSTEYKKIMDKREELEKRPLLLNDEGALSVDDVASIAYGIKDVQLIVIDYFGLLTMTGKLDNQVAEYSRMTRAMKRLAMRLEAPVLCLAQLNRDVEKRTNKRPILADLRETGTLEQDADGVIFLYRDDYYNQPETPVPSSLVEVIVAKNRHGPTGRTALSMYPATGVFKPAFAE